MHLAQVAGVRLPLRGEVRPLLFRSATELAMKGHVNHTKCVKGGE